MADDPPPLEVLTRLFDNSGSPSDGSTTQVSPVTELWTARFLTTIGTGFLASAPAASVTVAVKSDHINWLIIAAIFVGFWTIGGFLLAAGLSWPKWKPRNVSFARLISASAGKFWVWLIVLAIVAFGPILVVIGFQSEGNKPAALGAPPSGPSMSEPSAPKNQPRAYTNKTVEDLLGSCDGHTQMQCDVLIADEKGKWIATEGAVGNVYPTGMVIFLVGQKNRGVQCFFGEKWKPKLGTFSHGNNMKVVGKIDQVQVGVLNLQECELQ